MSFRFYICNERPLLCSDENRVVWLNKINNINKKLDIAVSNKPYRRYQYERSGLLKEDAEKGNEIEKKLGRKDSIIPVIISIEYRGIYKAFAPGSFNVS